MTTVGQDEAAQAMAERDPLPQVTYHVWTADEPTAGLQGERAEVRMVVDAEDDAEARTMLGLTFSVFWGEQTRRVRVSREEPPERTPETVLRAMLASYTSALFDTEIIVSRAKMDSHEQVEAMSRAQELRYDIEALLDEGSVVVAGIADSPAFHLTTDYQQRLSGARDLNAPPLE